MLPHLPAPKDVPASVRSQFAQESLTLDPPKDTYWEGKQLGTLTTLAGVAEALSDTPRQTEAIKTIRHRLERWLTFAGEQDAEYFYYDTSWGTLIGTPPSYGSDDQINDHHFHYGYFIRAAAEVARFDPDWAAEWGPRVELLIRDVASIVPNDPLFPRLRHFDPYAGHSWASGHAIIRRRQQPRIIFGSDERVVWHCLVGRGHQEILNCLILACISTTPNWWPLKSIGSTSTKPTSPMAFPSRRLASFGVEKTTTPLGSPRNPPTSMASTGSPSHRAPCTWGDLRRTPNAISRPSASIHWIRMLHGETSGSCTQHSWMLMVLVKQPVEQLK